MITSVQNPRIKEAVRLRDRRERNKSDLFLIEGYRELRRAVDAGRPLETFFYAPALFLGENEETLLRESGVRDCYCCTPEVFSKISYRDRPDGLLAIGRQEHRGLSSLMLKEVPFLLVAERIEKPGNLGSMLRSCDAAGVDAVLVCDPTTDIHNPNVVRSSVGTLFTQPVVEVGSEETLAFLRREGIAVVAATPNAEREYTQADFGGPVAVVVGSEQLGLSEYWMNNADIRVRIPMKGRADSLNVAAATTLLLYEVLRQRTSLF